MLNPISVITRIFLFSLFMLIGSQQASAQSEITFNVNLKPMLEDSSFVPGQHTLLIKGNRAPLNFRTGMRMEDKAPADSIYSVTITFSRTITGRDLEYGFFIRQPNGRETAEDIPRTFNLPGRKVDLDALYFNSFAW